MSEAVTRRCSAKKVFSKIRKIHRKSPWLESLIFIEKDILAQVISYEFC